MNTFYFDRKNEDFKPGQSSLDVKLITGDNSSNYILSCLLCVGFIVVLVGHAFATGLTLIIAGQPATIMDATLEKCIYFPESRKGSVVELTYSFEVSGQKVVIEGEQIYQTYLNACDIVPEGDTIEIKYFSVLARPEAQVIDSRFSPPLSLSPTFIFGLMFIFLCYYIFPDLRYMYLYRRAKRWIPLLQQGTVLNGVIVTASGQADNKKKSVFYLWVVYEFMSPTGVRLSRKQYFRRDDPNDQGVPAPGTPVKVVYVNDRCYVML